jgi:hypothetical protein
VEIMRGTLLPTLPCSPFPPMHSSSKSTFEPMQRSAWPAATTKQTDHGLRPCVPARHLLLMPLAVPPPGNTVSFPRVLEKKRKEPKKLRVMSDGLHCERHLTSRTKHNPIQAEPARRIN